jgi:hypothetical protein
MSSKQISLFPTKSKTPPAQLPKPVAVGPSDPSVSVGTFDSEVKDDESSFNASQTTSRPLVKQSSAGPKTSNKNLFTVLFYGEARDLINVIDCQRASKVAHCSIIRNSQKIVAEVGDQLTHLGQTVNRIAALDQDAKLTKQNAQDIFKLISESAVQRYLEANPIKYKEDTKLLNDVTLVAESKDLVAVDRIVSRNYRQGQSQFTFIAFPPELSVHDFADYHSSLFVYALDLSTYDEISPDGSSINFWYRIQELQNLVGSNFPEILVVFTNARKFLDKIKVNPLDSVFPDEAVPNASDSSTVMTFMYSKVDSAFEQTGISIGKLVLYSVFVGGDLSNMKQCFEYIFKERVKKDNEKLKKVAKVAVAASVAAVGGAIAVKEIVHVSGGGGGGSDAMNGVDNCLLC